jgi:hypothetical protein
MTVLAMSNPGLTLPQPEIAGDYAMQRHAIEPWLPAKFDAALSCHLDQLIVCEEFFSGPR